MTIDVLKPGVLSTLQDLGRYGYQRFGVVAGGAMDEWSHRVANALVANATDEATLELTWTGPSLRFGRTTLVALCGADLSPRIGDRALPQGRPMLLRGGSQLDFGPCRSGARAYLAVAGGYGVAPVLNSKSTFLRGGFGGYHGRALRKGDAIAVDERASGRYPALVRALAAGDEPFATTRASVVPAPGIVEGAATEIRVIRGAQWALFSNEARASLFRSEYRISPQSDRMGYRLEGPALGLREPVELISEAVDFGTVQVPPDGQPIILMADRQTTGGYPKIAHVAGVDLPLLAQMHPHRTLRLTPITLAQAQRLYVEREQQFATLRQSIESLRRRP